MKKNKANRQINDDTLKRGAMKTALGVFLLFLCMYFINASGHYYSIDGWANMLTAKSLAAHGSFAVEPKYAKTILEVGQRNSRGEYFSKYAPLTPLVMAPAAWVGLRLQRLAPPGAPEDFTFIFTCSFANSLVTALTVAALFLLCIAAGLGPRFSLATAALYGVATIALPYAKMCFAEPIAALAVTLCFCGLAWHKKSGSARWLAAVTISAAMMPLSRLSAVATALPLAAYALSAGKPRARIAGALAVIAGAVAGVLLQAAFNYYRFGSFADTGYGSEATMFRLATMPAGLYGLLLSSDKSFFVYSPLLLLFVPGLYYGYKRGLGAEMLCVGGIFAVNVLLYSAFENWGGGHSWGPRYLAPIVPACALAAGVLMKEKWSRVDWKALIIVLVAASVAVQFFATSVKFFTHYSNDRVKYEIETTQKEGKLFKPGPLRFIPLREQTADAAEHYGYTLSHLGGYFRPAPGEFENLKQSRLVENAPDFWFFLIYASASAKIRAAALAALLAILAMAFASVRMIRKNLKTIDENKN